VSTLRIEGQEGEPARDLSRDRYDLARLAVPEPRSVCHAPFAALHLGRTLAPCRHSTLDLGDARRTTLADGFTGEAVARLRERFRQYVVRRQECGRCVHHWEDGAAAESPALAEYDGTLTQLNGAPPRLRALSIDARVALPRPRLDEAIALLPGLERVVLLCDALESSGPARRIVTAVDRLRKGPRPRLELLASGFVPAPGALPASVSAVEVELPVTPAGLDAATRRRIAGLAVELSERGTPLTVRTRVGRDDWPGLKRWLTDVLSCDAVPVVEPRPRDDPESLAAVDADLLAALHGVLYRWSRELGIEGDDARGARSFSRLLTRLRHWQKLAAERTSAGPAIAMPELDHPLVRDEAEARRLLEDLLRVYHHPRVEQWLSRLAQHAEFVRGARERLSLRLAALWLGCVFERNSVRPALRAIYESAPAAAATIAADRELLAGTPMAGWHDGWVQALDLEKKPRAAAPFEIVPPKGPAAAGRARVTVVIPSFNHERFVGAAIDSVLAQSGPRVRVLVVDDGSTDETVAVARTRHDARIEVRENGRNLGLGESLYRALRTVRTPFVAVLNSDDLFHPARIDRLLAALQERPRAAVAASHLVPVDADGRACTTADASPIFDGKRVHDWLNWFESAGRDTAATADPLHRLLERNFLVTSSNMVARRDFLLDRAGLWRDLEYCVDWQVFLAAAADRALRVVPEPLLAYRLHASNTVWFDEEREWRYYVEAHRVVARTLELLLARGRGRREELFGTLIELVAGRLASNDGIDGAGLYVGLLLERLRIPSRALRAEQDRRWIQTLDAMRRMRLHVRDVVHVLGDNFSEFIRMRGERPTLRAARNRAEALADQLERMRWELQSAQEDRRNFEKLWRKAERERDHEVTGKADLYRRIGEVEGERDGARREVAAARGEAGEALAASERALQQAEATRKEAEAARREAEAAHRERQARESELERLREARSDLQTALQSVQSEHEQVRRDLEKALASLHAGQDRVKDDLVAAFRAVLSGHESVRTELVGAVERIQAERERIEGGLTDTLHGVARERDHLRSTAAREREALRSALERLHEETATLQEELERTRLALDQTRARAQSEQDAERTDTLHRLEEERRRLVVLFEVEHARLQTALDAEREEHARSVAEAREEHARSVAEAREEASRRLAESLAAEAAARVELAEEASTRVAELRAELEARAAAEQERLRAEAAAERERLRAEAAAERGRLEERVAAEQARRQAKAAAEQEQLRAAAAAEIARVAAEREAARADAAARAQSAAEAVERARRLEEEAARNRKLADQRAWEREELRRGAEFRLGNLVLNKMRLRRPLRAVEKGLHATRIRLSNARLAAERRGLIAGGGGKPRVFSTVCWNFPIWSQTFVYQELCQMDRRGFDVRLVYSRLEPREHLPRQFARLWEVKRVMHLDRAIHRRDYERMKARFPDRVERLEQMLCSASGLSREALVAHDNFLQGFSYARMAEAWGAQYLHSYFFYDRSLMSLIAGQVLGLPRGVSCYADHLLNDYELKVVPLHVETCDVVVATSARIKRELLALVPGTDPDKILVKPNAIDCTRFPVIPRVEPPPGEPFRVAVTSRIEPKKGLIYLVEAVKLLRDHGVDVEAHLVGDVDKGVASSENCKAELCDRITQLDLWGKVHLEGRQPEPGVRRFLSISQLFVAPFVETESGDKDGIPTALVEALATGIPAVVTDAGSMVEVVEDGIDGRIVPQRDPRALAAALRELLLDAKRRRSMGHQAAQKMREQFDVSVCEPRLHERVRALVAARRK